VFTPYIWRHPLAIQYTLPAPPLAGSLCNHWYKSTCTLQNAYLMHFVFLEWLLRSQVAPNFKFFQGSARTLLCELTALPRPRSWWGGGSLPPAQELHPRGFGPSWRSLAPSLWLTLPHVNSWIKLCPQESWRRQAAGRRRTARRCVNCVNWVLRQRRLTAA